MGPIENLIVATAILGFSVFIVWSLVRISGWLIKPEEADPWSECDGDCYLCGPNRCRRQGRRRI